MHLLSNAIASGVLLAGLYVIGGLAWVILFRAAKILNFSTGQFIVLGAYFYYLLVVSVRLPFWAALIGAVLAMALIGGLVQAGPLTRLLGAVPHATGHAPFVPVILTLGISTIAQHLVTMTFGGQARSLPSPLSRDALQLAGGIVVTYNNVFVWSIALVLLATTLLVIKYSRLGIQMRAAAEQPLLASQSGVDVERVFIGAWAVSAGICALAGISYSYSSAISPDLANIGLRSMAPAIVGGLDSTAGVLPGAIIVAVAENLMVLVFGEGARDAAVMVVILAMLAIRPTGLFGTGDIRRL